MKGRSLLGLGMSLAVLTGVSLPVFAQSSQRYPTNAEIRELMRGFQEEIQYTQENRNYSEIQKRESFARAWSSVDPEIAPFLGQWTGDEQLMLIFPSNVRGRVCIVGVGFDPSFEGPATASFRVGDISNSQIRTSDRNLIINQGNYLDLLGVHGEYGAYSNLFAFPKPVPTLTSQSLFNAPELPTVIQQFNEAGCTASLPQNVR